jgi:hypothetical protein
MPEGTRLWRTENGDLVEEGHPEALLLAYGEGDELSAEDAKGVRKQAPKSANKQAPKSVDKQASAPKNK